MSPINIVLMILVVILGIGAVIYFFYNKKAKKAEDVVQIDLYYITYTIEKQIDFVQ